MYTSRKSTQSRQRQYFEQKKRQQQRPGLESQIDIEDTGNQAYRDQAPRSLDVLSLNNLATPVSHHNGSENADNAVSEVDCTILNASPIEALKKITSSYDSNQKEASSQPRLSSPFGHQDVAAAINPHEDPLGCKVSPSKNNSAKKRNQNVELHREISLIDLVSDEGPKNKSTAQPAREAHVSFSVKGLGYVKMETPPQSPRSIKRILPLPPKAKRYTQNKARRSIPFDATKELDSIMNGINMLKERRPSDKMGSLLDESGYEWSKKYNCYFPHSFENNNDNLYPEDEDMFCEPQAEKCWKSKRGRDDNLLDVNSERLWKIESFNSEDHFPTPRVEQFGTIDYGFKDRYSPERRTSTRTSTRFETSGIPSSHDLFSDHSLMDDDEDVVHFDWERHPPIKKISNSKSTFGPSAWSFDMVDDSEKMKSPLSEESCSSAAVMKDRTCKEPSLSVKCEENKMSEKDDFHISLDKLDIPKMDAHLDGISLFSNPEEYHKRTTDQRNFEADYWPDKATGQQRTREPSCCLSLGEKFANWGSPTSHLKGGTGLNNPSSCTVMCEDKPFNSSPDMSMYQTVGSTERRPASKVPPVFHRPDNAIFDDDIHLQNPVSDIFGDKIEFSNPFCATDLRSDIDMSNFLGQKIDKNKEDNFDTFKNPNADIFLAKKSVSSVGQTVVGQHSTCSQASGKDSLRQGFSPGINNQESRLASFWEDGHVNNGTFEGDLELSGLLARKNGDANKDKIEKFKKPETKVLTETSQPSANCRIEMSETETCSVLSEVTNYPGVQKETSAAATQLPANLSCLQETSGEMFQVHAHVECVTKEKIEDPGVDFKAPLHLRNKIHDVGDHSNSNSMFQTPFIGEEVGIEKKIIASVSPNNSDVQYQVMLEHRVLRRLCVQKIVVDTPMKGKQDKDKHFRMMEDGSHVLAKSV